MKGMERRYFDFEWNKLTKTTFGAIWTLYFWLSLPAFDTKGIEKIPQNAQLAHIAFRMHRQDASRNFGVESKILPIIGNSNP
jgi:hypothetical protein